MNARIVDIYFLSIYCVLIIIHVKLSNAHIESWNETNYISIEKEACRACTRIARDRTRKSML